MASTKFLLTMKLNTQGDVKGSRPRKGALDYSLGVECHGYAYSVITPLDPQTGGSSGKRQHNPITIRKEVDEASPLFLQALCTNEGFKVATLSFNKPGGQPGLARVIELYNGHIIKIQEAPSSGKRKCEDVILGYESLTVDGLPDGFIPHSFLP